MHHANPPRSDMTEARGVMFTHSITANGRAPTHTIQGPTGDIPWKHNPTVPVTHIGERPQTMTDACRSLSPRARGHVRPNPTAGVYSTLLIKCLFLCLHLFINSVLLFNKPLWFDLAIITFSVKHKLHLFVPYL